MVMHGPDGTNYLNVYHFVAIDPAVRAVLEHPGDPHWFELTIAFDETPTGTRITWRQRFEDEAHFAEIKDFIAAANEQVLSRLAAVVAA